MTYDERETIPVPRRRVFVLKDGAFVVQWEENRVQDLLTGKYRPFAADTAGNPISDYELSQLKNAGVVDRYDVELIHLCPTPDIIAHTPARSYYLNTALPKARKDDVEACLQEFQLADKFSVRTQEKFVIIRGPNGMAFTGFDDAEKARELLLSYAPQMFDETVVAFVEIIALA
jgi:hypothetical protein